MGTEYSISIVADSQSLADQLSNSAIKEIQLNEEIFSRFKEDSELSILNREKNKIVSSRFLEIALESYKLFILTKGIFNPLVQIEKFGYNKNFNDILGDKDNLEVKKYDIDFNSTIIDLLTSKIILQKDQKLDFGGFLKGYIAEKICKDIKNHSDQIQGVIVNIGGDIHTQGLDENNNKFVFNIFNPIKNSEEINVTLYNQSLATSGTYKRNWGNSKFKIHHILDSSGIKNPKNDIVSSSVICDHGGESEAYAKVFLSSGLDKNFIKINKKIKVILIKENGDIIKNKI